MSSNLQAFLSRILGTAATAVLSQVITGVTYVLAARRLGPAELGLYSTGIAVASIAVTILDFGLGTYAAREVAAKRIPLTDALAITRTKRLVVVPIAILLTLAAISLDIPTYWCLTPLLTACLWNAQVGAMLARSQDRYARVALAQLVSRAAGLIAFAAGAQLGGYMLPASLVLVSVVEAEFYRWGWRRNPVSGWHRLITLQRNAISFGMTGVASLAQLLDTPIVAMAGGSYQAGIYAAGSRLLNPLSFMSAAVGAVSAPWLAKATAAGHLPEEERRVLHFSVWVAAAPIFASLSGLWLVPILLGEEYASARSIVIILSFGVAMSTLSQGLAIILQNQGRQSRVARTIGGATTCGLVASFALTTLAGAVGGAAGFVISQGVILTLLAISAYRCGVAGKLCGGQRH